MSGTVPFLFAGLLLLAACHSTTTNNHVKADSLIEIATVTDPMPAPAKATPVIDSSVSAPGVENALPLIDTSDAPIAALVADTGSIVLDTISGSPDFVEGCIDAASISKKTFEHETYVISGNGADIMMIKIKGVRVYMRRDTKHPETENNTWFTGHGYTVHIITGKTQSFEESDSFSYEGRIEVERGGKKFSAKIWGGGAC